MFQILLTLLPIGILAAPSEVIASPSAQTLIEDQCVRCHGSEVYTRDDRRIQSLAGLEGQVRRCASNLELQWFDEEILAVTEHLNERYYHFKP